MHEGPSCDACRWEVRDSDRFCCFCGTLQRRLEFTPSTLSLGVLDGGSGSGEQVSAGRLVLTATGLLPVRVLALTAPEGVAVSSEPPLPPASHGGLMLPLQSTLTVTGRQVGDVAEEPAWLVVTTSIGTLRLPIRTEPPPAISLEPETIQLPEGKPSVVPIHLVLAEGSHLVRLGVSGSGLRLVAPTEELRLIAGVPLRVEIEADPRDCAEPETPGRLAVDLGWTSLGFDLRFETVVPGRLLPAGGRPNIDFRVFPGDNEEELVELRNPGSLPFLLADVSLRTDDGEGFTGVEIELLEPTRHQPLALPAEIPPNGSVLLRLRCNGGEPPGLRQSGTLTLDGPGMEPLRLAFLLDTREPAEHRLPVGLDFGTSASAVATRQPRESRPGQVVSLPFRPPMAGEGDDGTYLPSDVQIVHDPTRGEPLIEIDWGSFNEDWHLLFARNLKRRVGLRAEMKESKETVFIDGRRFDLPVEDLAVFVIEEMRRQAERELGARIREGLATVPTRFSLRRIQAIRELYHRAGFEKIALIDESVAAGILGMYNQFLDRSEYTMLVYDMGGGTTDVTLFRVENRKVGSILEIRPQILGVAGDPQLGGRDVTDLMVERVIDNLSAEEREILLWPDKLPDAPELQLVAKRNASELFSLAEKAKLELFPGVEEPAGSVDVRPSLWVSTREVTPFTECSFTAEDVQEAIRPRLERLWRQILDLLTGAGVDSLDILYLVGRSSRLPIIHQGLTAFLAEHARSPKLETIFPTDREGRGVLKEAVSLGACLALDLLTGIGERLMLPRDGEQAASRFGLRDPRGDFLELLPSGWRIGQPSEQRISLRLPAPFRPGIYETRLEVWENLTPNPRVDDNPDAEMVGTAHIELSAEEVGPTDPEVEVGLVLEEDRTLHLLVHWDGETRKVPIES